jgi:hypothetical protein
MRASRPAYRDLPAGAKRKAIARSYARVYQRRGKLVPMPCACGSTDAQMHHPDYRKPLEVVWICRPCHLALHKEAP